MTTYRHIIFRITIVAFLAAFLTFISGCVKPGYGAVKSEGRDKATRLWKEIVHKKSGIVLRLVPAGEFDMGSPSGDKERGSDDGSVHRVKISEPFFQEWQAEWLNNVLYQCEKMRSTILEPMRLGQPY